MATYTILIKNHSGATRAYFLFIETPNVTGSNSPKVFQNVYIAAPSCASPNGTANFTIIKSLYAVTGSSPQNLGSGVTVTTGDWEPVNIAQDNTYGNYCAMTMPAGEGPYFDTTKYSATVTTPGAFEIGVDNSFSYPNPLHPFIGLGAQDPNDATNIVPVATFDAQPGTNNFIFPVSRYYISWGTYVAGEIIDVSTIATPVMVDFTGSASTECTVTHNSDGTWTPHYNAPVLMDPGHQHKKKHGHGHGAEKRDSDEYVCVGDLKNMTLGDLKEIIGN